MNATLFGQLAPWPHKQDLAAILEAAGLRTIVGTYSIRLADAAHFVFQNYGGDLGEPQVEADAESVTEMLADARRVSDALVSAGIRHRFEIYDDDDKLAAYLHWDWPQITPGASSQ